MDCSSSSSSNVACLKQDDYLVAWVQKACSEGSSPRRSLDCTKQTQSNQWQQQRGMYMCSRMNVCGEGQRWRAVKAAARAGQ
jgi:hypothetical protein